MNLKPFSQPVYVTRPLLPSLELYQDKLKEIWETQWLSNNGKQHQQFETRMRETLKVPYLSLFNNGTIALIVAVQSLRLSGEVITTPFTFPATPHVLAWNNIKPIFCDVDPVTMNLDAEKIESMITPQTTGILGVHVFGTPCDVIKIQDIADRHGLKVVYDAAHAFQVEIDGMGIGGFGDISMFSFHPTKLFHTGEGGALTYNNSHLKNRIDLLKNFGIKNEEEVIMPGINGKMNELQAALGSLVLDCLEEERAKRKRLLTTYHACFENIEGISFFSIPDHIQNSYQYFVIRINEERFGKSRDAVYEACKAYNLFPRKYFFPLCSDYPCYKQLHSSHPDNLPNARQIVQEVLCLPFYGGLEIPDVEKICAILRQIKG